MSPFGNTSDAHDFTEDDLIAYHLHELPAARQRLLRRALQLNADLAAASESIAATLDAFPKNEAALPLDAAARDRLWVGLLPSLVVHFPKSPARVSVFRRWPLPLLAASACAATALFVSLHPFRRAQHNTVASVEQHPPSAPNLSPSLPTPPNALLSNDLQPSPFHAGVQPNHRAQSSSPTPFSTPHEPPTTINSPSVASATPPASLSTMTPSPDSTGPASAQTSASPLATVAPPQASTHPSAPPSTKAIQPRQPRSVPRPVLTELTLAMFGDITNSVSYTSTNSGISQAASQQTATPAVGALASLRQQLSPWRGYRITAAYSRPTFESAGLQLQERTYEYSGTYVVQGPHRGHFTSSAEAGAGLLDVHYNTPDETPVVTAHSLRAAGVFGVGTELAISKHWGLRAEYRAVVYKPPPFYNTCGCESLTAPSKLTLINNPVFGITYRFGAKSND